MEQNRGKRGRPKLPGLNTPEREDRKRAQKRKSDETRVRIGAEADRWLQIKSKYGLRKDVDVAKLLMDSYDALQLQTAESPIFSSTPSVGQCHHESDSGSDVSGVSPMMSELSSPVHEDAPSSSTSRTSHEALYDLSVKYEEKDSFVYLKEGDLDSEGSVWDVEEHLSDISDILNESHPTGLEDIDLGDILDCSEHFESAPYEVDESSDDTLDIEETVETTKFIAFESCFRQLIEDIPIPTCTQSNCKAKPTPEFKFIGTALSVKWVCSDGHVCKKWDSQPKARRNFAGDIALSAAIIFSGNNYEKISSMFHHMKMGVVNRDLHSTVQREYTFPAIEEYWLSIQDGLLESRRGKDVIISGDGRNDSPGFSAQYCTYTTMDYESGDILDIRVIDKREAEYKSTNMEKMAFLQMLQLLQGKGLVVKEIVTDAHLQITALLKQYPDIFHSHDVWHGAKNIGKKLAEAAKKSKNQPLLKWTGDITRHFWYCAKNCNDNTDLFLARWRGILHHVVGEHEWILGDGVGPAKCDHGPLPEDWNSKKLDAGGPAHETLCEIVLNEKLLRNLYHFQRFRFTHKLENFQSHILAYAAKRFSYGHPSYKARNYLAALDYQHHKDRTQKMKDNAPVYSRHFAKASGRWTVRPVMENKPYAYIPEILRQVFRKRMQDKQPQQRQAVLSEDDPRRLSSTIYPVPPPSVDELLLSHQPRM